jgi:hypothetical protein
MNLKEEILKEHSKRQTDRIIRYIGADQKKFDELIHLFLHEEYRVVQRAAWPLSYIAIRHPDLISKHLNKIVRYAKNPKLHNAVKRNVVRFLQHIEIPKKLQGDVMDLCFYFLESSGEPVAIKAFSLTVLGNLAKQYPEIITEIKLLVEHQIHQQSAAFRSRARKVMKELNVER